MSQKSFDCKLAARQRLGYLDITDVMSTTSSPVLNTLLNLQPLDLFIQSTVMRAAHRVTGLDLWGNNRHGGNGGSEELLGKPESSFEVFYLNISALQATVIKINATLYDMIEAAPFLFPPGGGRELASFDKCHN